MIENLEDEAICRHRPLHGQPELLLNCDFVVLGRLRGRFHLLAHELGQDVCINCAESIHLGKSVRSNKSDLELFVLLFDLGGHHHQLVWVFKRSVFA